MKHSSAFEIIERIAALMRSEERKKCTELGLQPVHFQILDYLSRCNRFSDSPAALTNYLGMTRGTVSQSLQLLEKRGYIKKAPDIHDRRSLHLGLLADGEALLAETRSNELLQEAATYLENTQDAEKVFSQALFALQKANKSQTFGLCKTCSYFTRTEQGFLCGLTREALTESDSEKLCQEHSVR